MQVSCVISVHSFVYMLVNLHSYGYPDSCIINSICKTSLIVFVKEYLLVIRMQSFKLCTPVVKCLF